MGRPEPFHAHGLQPRDLDAAPDPPLPPACQHVRDRTRRQRRRLVRLLGSILRDYLPLVDEYYYYSSV